MSEGMSSVPTPPAKPAATHPMRVLYERIDQVRGIRKDLPEQLRNIATELPNARSRATLQRLADALETKTSAANLVAQFPQHCWLLTLQSSAATTDAMTAILEQSTFQHRLQAKTLRTLAYPMVLLSVASLILLAALALLVPPFDEMFAEFGLRLPAPTLLLIRASRIVSENLLLAVGVVVALLAAVAFVFWILIGDGRIKRSLRGPSTSPSKLRQSLANACLQLAELCDEGLTLDKALKITAESNTDVAMRNLCNEIAVQAAHDPSKFANLRAAAILPLNFLFALCPAYGDQGAGDSRPNTTLLRALAANYRESSILRNEWISLVLAQITIIGVGLTIGFAVTALFLPLVSLVSALSG